MTFNGIEFENCGTTHINTCKERSLYDCYASPSHTKSQIWEYWNNWFIELCNKDFVTCARWGVASYNCHFFTIEGIVKTEDDITYRFVITSAHNRVYTVV